MPIEIIYIIGFLLAFYISAKKVIGKYPSEKIDIYVIAINVGLGVGLIWPFVLFVAGSAWILRFLIGPKSK